MRARYYRDSRPEFSVIVAALGKVIVTAALEVSQKITVAVVVAAVVAAVTELNGTTAWLATCCARRRISRATEKSAMFL